MDNKATFTEEQLKYLRLLSQKYPTVQDACTEIINLKAILALPKGTEHFISDIHGEHEAFYHMINACSGVIKDKLNMLFGSYMTRAERDELATLIYYPREKMRLNPRKGEELQEWYRLTLYRLIPLCRNVTDKYTRSKVRKALPKDFAYILDELIHLDPENAVKQQYFDTLINSILDTGCAEDFIAAVCETIKSMAVDRIHIVGDIFDRGPRADKVMDHIMSCRTVDIQWGNHDILWMGAAAGSRTLVATVLANSIHYNNLAVLEVGYGISLRPLSVFANDVYANSSLSCWKVSMVEDSPNVSAKDRLLASRMYKAISIILFKLEGSKVLNRPEFGMQDRALLHRIDYEKKCITINGKEYPLLDTDFPTVDPADPYCLTEEENRVIDQLVDAFRHSEKLQAHVRYLYSNGAIYKVHNNNLLFHGCIPMTENGDFMSFCIGGRELSGKAFLNYANRLARKAYYDPIGSEERRFGMDFLWWLWGGRNSPIFGRAQLTTFERRLIQDPLSWAEPKNAYYQLYHDPAICVKVLQEFGLEGPHCHIINGHVPVKTGKGESPIKGGGKLIVIDGGFCKAYQPTSGIAGYTLILSSHDLRIVAHQPFVGRDAAIAQNLDIVHDSRVIEFMEHRMLISQTDNGRLLQQQIDELELLLSAYRTGAMQEAGKKA